MVNLSNLFLAVRPAFLLITVLGCLLGILSANSFLIPWHLQALSILVTVSIHGGANLFNDYFDHLNGGDAINTQRISPFTGGGRFIQNKIFKPSTIYRLAFALSLFSILIGTYICSVTTWLLIPIGGFGIFIAWAYSAPPLQLMSKGFLGELTIAVAWSLVVVGFSALSSSQIRGGAILVGMSYGLMVSNILLINQIPDREADLKVKKYTLATQCSIHRLNFCYTSIYSAAYICQILAVYVDALPGITLLTLLLLPVLLSCTRIIKNAALERQTLKSLIVRNLVCVHAFAILMCLCLIKSA